MDDSEGVLFPKNISSLGKIQNAKQVAERQEIDSHTLVTNPSLPTTHG
jgi:hypothetical protein